MLKVSSNANSYTASMGLSSAAPTASVVNALGRRIYFDPTDVRGKRLELAGGDLNPHSLQLWQLAIGLHDWDVVVDVGTNYGEMIVGVPIPAETRIMAFEPNARVVPYLKKTLAEFERPVELAQAAVSDTVGHGVPFAQDASWSGSSSLILDREETAADEIVRDGVEVTTLDAAFGESTETSACIKVDVEGNEMAVLRGAAATLGRLGRWAVMIEILHMNTSELGQIISAHHFYLLDQRTAGLVRVRSTNPEVLHAMLTSGWVYPQDAVLLSSPLTSWAA